MGRRAFLAMAGTGLLAFAGCLSRSDVTSRNDISPSDGPWPQFGRTPRNTGYSPEVSGPTTDPTVAWRFDGGTPTMNSSPVVVDDTVYVPGSGDPGYLHAVDVATGDPRWRFEPAGYASTAPAVADGTLYFGTWGKRLYAVETATGDVEWSTRIGHRFGTSSPVVVNGTVYVGTIGDGPLRVSDPDEEEFEACAFLAVDAATGEPQWRYREFDEKDRIDSSPAVGDGRVYFGAKNSLYALDTTTGEVVWRRLIATPVHPEASPAVANGRVYYGTYSPNRAETPTRLWALDAATGETVWTAGIDDDSLRTSPAVAGETVYVAASSRQRCVGGFEEEDCSGVTRGRLYAFGATSGDRRWTVDIETAVWSSPAVADGHVYVGCGDCISAVTTDGDHTWRLNFEGDREDGLYVKSSPAVGDGHVFVGATDGRLRAITGQ